MAILAGETAILGLCDNDPRAFTRALFSIGRSNQAHYRVMPKISRGPDETFGTQDTDAVQVRNIRQAAVGLSPLPASSPIGLHVEGKLAWLSGA
jgi:hypothetical protein